MMNKFIHLLIGEFTRLKKYNVILVNLLVTAIWLLALYFIEDNNLFNSMLPFILMIDTTMMASLFIGATRRFFLNMLPSVAVHLKLMKSIILIFIMIIITLPPVKFILNLHSQRKNFYCLK